MPAMIAWKTIKPQRMRDDKLRLELLNAVRKAGTAIRKDYARTTKTWKQKPEFQELRSLSGAPPGPSILVGTDDVIYKFVDEGTKPHEIWAGIYTGKSNKKALAFRGVYKSKTLPGVLDARSGGSSGPYVIRPFVQHPGTKARNFTKIIEKTWRPKFKDLMVAAMVRAARASGHGG